jgi:hypothetical protein
MKKLDFVWIDDKKSKVEDYRAVIESGVSRRGASIELIQIKAGALETLSNWVTQRRARPPDLVIIDHVFDLSLPFALKGSSVAHLLRGAFPLVPMVCVTAMFNRARVFDQEDLSEYTALFLYQHLEREIESLYAIARDFGRLHSIERAARSHIVDCLKPPKRDRNHLLSILPEEFKDEKHATTEHRAARWIWSVFLRRPGFVYDKLRAATLFGLTEGGFDKISHLFERARYKGVFATDASPRWWVTALTDQLYGMGGPSPPDMPQHAGRMLPGVQEAHHSVCYVSRKSVPPPDAVVAVDATHPDSLRVVRREYSDSHPDDSGVTPGFETQLILKRNKR